ncbi:hypothetical protein WEU38_06720 [Cyanobacterium aponinum AL20118]|uniref:Uncharacterized protein n=1 Tax=Cyanobacterium aponinum AL20115 TaxID=3090662 RepID=A0AAF0ZDL8_9CHRO|nr:hypothetical protein [Cyanobacterium aponinum]PHV64183.1 hypothetical protein CSQ80_01410 [Cyanobacterium aponinum IPPAS B-1201]WPF89958.1 hypothetical protein SAY89_06745 [Cyanobacterium aponinum AL20115]
MSGGKKKKIDNHGFALIEQIIQQKPDLIFSELCQLFKEKTGVKVSEPTMYRYVQKLNITRKKSLSASEQQRDDIKKTIRISEVARFCRY